jgi:endonuclease G, mitochondrial
MPSIPTGYDPEFLGSRIDVPQLTEPTESPVVAHTHFSLQMDQARRFASWVAWNIDGGSLKALSRKRIRFVLDPQVPDGHQVGDELYRDNDLDRGHLARRADLLWGDLAEAKRANVDSFFFTNITPQMNDFNQSVRAGVWGQLEDAVFADVEVEDLRVSVFGGPVFQADDRRYRGVQLPREYWKVLAFREQGTLRARGFLLTQNIDQLEALELGEFRVFQLPLTRLENRTGLRFDGAVRAADAADLEAVVQPQPLVSVSDISW